MRKILITLLVTICVASAGSNGVLRVAMELAYPPFEMTDTHGNPSGFSVDFAKELGKALGYKKVKIENISWTGLIPSLMTDRADVVISSMTPTPERAKRVDFSKPYAVFRLSMLTNSKSGINSLKDIVKGKVVAVKIGTTADTLATKEFEPKGVKVIRLQQDNAAALEVVKGSADVFIYDQLSILRYHHRYPKQTKMIFSNLQTMPVAVVVKKGNKKLLAKINKFIVKYQANGGFVKLANRYLSKEMAEFRRLHAPFIFDQDK